MNLARALSLALFAPVALAANIRLKGEAGKAATAEVEQKGKGKSDELTLTFTGLHAYQSAGLFAVIVHDESVGPVFTPNEPATAGFARLCETGSNADFIAEFEATNKVSHSVNGGALFAKSFEGADFSLFSAPMGIGSIDVTIPMPQENEVITAAAMLIFTNDGCVLLDGVHMEPGDSAYMTIVDAGSEENVETCETMGACPPGIGLSLEGTLSCPCGDVRQSGPQPVENAEGFMSLHSGVGLRNPSLYGHEDWRGPVVMVTAS